MLKVKQNFRVIFSIFAFSLMISIHFPDLLKIPLTQQDVHYFLNFFREAKQRKEESKLSNEEKYRGDRDRRDNRKRDRDERRNKERSPDRYDGHKARSREKSSDSTYRSARDTEEDKWGRRDDEGSERVKHDTTRFLRPADSDNRYQLKIFVLLC